jgi:hypothetical protein
VMVCLFVSRWSGVGEEWSGAGEEWSGAGEEWSGGGGEGEEWSGWVVASFAKSGKLALLGRLVGSKLYRVLFIFCFSGSLICRIYSYE